MGRKRIKFEAQAKELATVLEAHQQLTWPIIAGFLQAFDQRWRRSLSDYADKEISAEYHFRMLKKFGDPGMLTPDGE